MNSGKENIPHLCRIRNHNSHKALGTALDKCLPLFLSKPKNNACDKC